MYTDGVVPPRLHIFESCHNLINEIVNAITDEKDMERIDKECPDHALDAMRYLLMYLKKASRPKEHAITNPNTFDSLVNDIEPEDESPYYRG